MLRARDGDPVEICDSGGRSFDATLTIEGPRVRATLRAVREQPPAPRLELTLAQGLPRAQKMDYIVEKATELGVARVVPFSSERSVAANASSSKLERWRRIARTAAQQCGRTDVPAVESPVGWNDVCATLSQYDVALVPWELAEHVPLRERLPELLHGARSALVAIGPEGGFAQAEVSRALESGAHAVSLGRRILRTETAGLVVCSALRYAGGEL